VETEKMKILASTFDCQIGSYPFTYLGLPMGLSKPKLEDFLPLVQRIEKRLLSTSTFLNQAGRVEMVNVVLSTLPTFFMGNVKLPPSIYKQIDKFKKHCMWTGSDWNATKPPLAAWKLATRPKENGGMGIINVATQNDALLLKNLHKFFNKLHKFFNKLDVPWVQLIWNNYYRNGTVPDGRPKRSFWWRGLLKLWLNSRVSHLLKSKMAHQHLSGLISGVVKSEMCSTWAFFLCHEK
jgi:hypothetical protein